MWPGEDAITLKGMKFHVRVGILPHEQEYAQPLEVDLVVLLRAGSDVVDYRGLYDDAASVVSAGPLHYLEDVAEAIAQRVLARERVSRAHVSVRKPNVALGGPLDYAEVSITRPREHGRLFR